MLTQQELYLGLHLFDWNTLGATGIAICNPARNFLVPCGSYRLRKVVRRRFQALQQPDHERIALALGQRKRLSLKVFE